MPSVVFRRDHLRFSSGIICGSGSFAVQFGDYLRSGDHLRSGIICGAVQAYNFLSSEKIYRSVTATLQRVIIFRNMIPHKMVLRT